jgi:tetratricopeptide (TPR) repeat protein
VWSLSRTRPLTYFTYWLNYQLGGQDPLGYHAVNLMLHLGCVLLASECLRRLLPQGVALFAAAIFALHPLQAESVDYVWGRAMVLATLFCLLSLLAWLEGRYWVAVACFALALLAKEECAAFPLVLLLFDRKRFAPIGAMLALSVSAGAHTIYAAQATPGALAGAQAGVSPAAYLLAQGPVILRYLRLLVVPYGFSVDPDVRVPQIAWGVLAWVAVGVFAWLAWRKKWIWLAAGLILLLPSSSIFPAADLAADRRMYFPLLAFGAGIALILEKTKPAVLGSVAAVLLILTFSRTMVWNNDETLWREAVERGPEKVRPRIQLARHLRAERALDELNAARRISPRDPDVAAEIGRVLLSEGQTASALEEFGHALAADPHNPRNYNNRGVALATLGQTAAARADFEQALRIDPNFEEARENLKKLGF